MRGERAIVVVVHGTNVHGTWWRPRQRGIPWWRPDSPFCKAIAACAGDGCEFVEFKWSGKNTHAARVAAGQQLSDRLRRIREETPDAAVHVIGHSHGGNVALLAVNQTVTGLVNGLILLANPQMALTRNAPRQDGAAADTAGADTNSLDGEGRRWLYWSDAPSRVDGTIWNLYSPQDSVQTWLSRWFSGLSLRERGGVGRRLHVYREYSGPGHEKVHNGRINWHLSGAGTTLRRMFDGSGIRAHSAMHCERMGGIIGLLIAGESSFDRAVRACGLTLDGNDITDTGAGCVCRGDDVAASGVPQYQFPTFDVQSPPYRANLRLGAGKRPGVLLVHGFTAAPTEMRPLAEYLLAREPDWALLCVQLAGHGGTFEDLKGTTDEDWFRSVVDGYEELRQCANPVFVVGLSLGSALCVRLVAEYPDDPIAGVVLLAPVFDLPKPAAWFLGAYGLFADVKPKSPERASYYETHGLYSHMAYPVNGLKCVRRNGKIAWRTLPHLKVPTLIVAGGLDDLVKPRNVRRLAARIGRNSGESVPVEVMSAPGSGHILTVEPDARDVFEKCRAFMKKMLPLFEQSAHAD